MSETPRTNEIDAMWDKSDSAVDAFNDAISLCRELERELADANERISKLQCYLEQSLSLLSKSNKQTNK